MQEEEIKNLIKKVQAGEAELTSEQKLEFLKLANQKTIELNDYLKKLL